MTDVRDVAAAECWQDQTWLIGGKGPSFDADLFARRGFSIALNHVIDAVSQATLAHCVDLEVAVDCAAAISRRARFLLMPWCPNIRLRIQQRSLQDLAAEHKILAELCAVGRLLAYNRRESPRQNPDLPSVSAIYFSAEAAFGVLAVSGVKRIETVGIDGGRDYAKPFAPLTPLENGQSSFDRQFSQLQQIVTEHGIQWTRIGGGTVA